MPASSSASSSPSPFSRASSMKSKSTMTWLTMTPTRLTIPRKAMKPKGDPMTHSAATAPTKPYGIAPKTISGLTAFWNCTASAR